MLIKSLSSVKADYAAVNGTRLYYEMLGAGHPLVLIHGAHLDRRMWDEQFHALAQQCKVIRYDVRDNGLSKCPPGQYADHEDLFALLNHLRIERAALIGLSFGGSLAIDFTLSHPEKVSALIPVSTGLSGYNSPSAIALENNSKMMTAWAVGDMDGVVEFYQHSWTDGPYRKPNQVDPVVRMRAREMIAERVKAGASVGEKLLLMPPAIGRLHEIQVPVLSIVGDLDMPDMLSISALLFGNINGAKQALMSGVAHMLNMERPGEFNQIVLDFLSDIGLLEE